MIFVINVSHSGGKICNNMYFCGGQTFLQPDDLQGYFARPGEEKYQPS